LLLMMALVVTGCTEPPPANEATSETAEMVPVITEVSKDVAPAATATPRPLPTARPTNTPMPTPTAVPTATPSPEPTATSEPTATLESTATLEPAATLESTATPKPAMPPAPSVPQPPAVVSSSSALTVLDDVNTAPPLSVHVSANQALEGYRFRVSGTIRNDAAENYTGLGIVATFYTSDGSRYGPIKANPACLLLAPGDECPFMVEALSKDLVAVMLHPEGYPTSRGAAPLTLSGLRSYRDGVGYVHLTGRVTNANPFAVKNVTVNGALLNAAGEIVSVGMSILIDNVTANGAATFDVAVPYTPYTNYKLYVQGEPQ